MLALLSVPGQASTQQTLRIMPMGDSITAGYTDNPHWNEPLEFGYRSGLYTRLTAAGYNFELVGSSAEPWNNAYGDPTKGGTVSPLLDLRSLGQDGHNGYGGKTASFLNANIHTWLAEDSPDIILLKIGTNSQDQAGLNALVNTITTVSPDTHLIIAEIMPKGSYQQGIVNYNTYIRDTLVPQYQSMGKKVTSVDQYTNFLIDPNDLSSIDPSLFSNRWNHPDNLGYGLMAQTWFDGIQSLNITPAPSSIVITEEYSTTQFAFDNDVSTNDLLHGAVPTGASGWNTGGNASLLELTDGVHGGAYNIIPSNMVQGAWTRIGATAEYNLGTGESGLGYDLTSIQSIADWVNAGFGNQGWTVEVKHVSSSSYTTLATVDYQALGKGVGTTKVTLTNNSWILASGVEFIRVTATSVNRGANGGAFLWREFDVFGSSTFAPSAIVITEEYSTAQFAFDNDVSTYDLLHGVMPTGASGWNTGGNASLLELTDGVHGGAYNIMPSNKVQGAWTTAGATAEYDLGTGESGLGYDLTSIQSIADWVDAGLGNQGWTVEVKRVDSGAYTTLATVDCRALGNGVGTTKITLTNNSGILASGVEFIRVTATSVNGGANGGAFVWREFDVFGY
jgi:Tfp pilus assembly protein PilX